MEENSKSSPPQWWTEEPPDETPVELYVAWVREEVGKVRKIKLANGKYITLNQQQNEALDLASLWIQDRTQLFFTLEGRAGSGKSTIAKEIIKEFQQKNRWGGVAVSAPTHKAKKVISNFTGMEGETIQALLGLMPNTELADFDINKPEFAMKKKPTIESYKLVVIDEGSMINSPLWDMLKTQARRFNTKMLILGDSQQLPPIKEDKSMVFLDADIKYKYFLSKVERQSDGNPLMFLYDAIRDNMDSSADQFELVDKLSEVLKQDSRETTIAGYRFFSNINKFGTEVVNAFRSEEFQLDSNHCKVLCWTNAQVEFWNSSIRKTLIADLSRDPMVTQEVMLHANVLMPNELLMAYKTYNEGLQNSGEYEVISMQYDSKKVWYGDTKQYSTEIRGYRVAMRDVDQDTIMNTFIVDPEPDNVTTFAKVHNSYLFLAKTARKWPEYYNFKGQHLLMKNVYDNTRQLVVGKDLDYAYSQSIHKSQGSTFDQVFVDMQDVNKNKIIVERNKLKYVALSRPRYLATIFTGGAL
ncbi:unnamed protein product [Sphagnum balticum]